MTRKTARSLLISFLGSFLMPFYAYGVRCSSVWLEAKVPSDLPVIQEVSAKTSGFGFIVPNETRTELLKPLIQKAPAGVYVSVGTERGFMSAALLGERSKALVLADLAPQVVFFNRINTALLSLATSREKYVFLRTQADFNRLQQELVGASFLSKEHRALLSRPEVWSWWIENVQKLSGWNDFHQNPQEAYRDANYLFEDRLFKVISQLAKNDRIFVFQENIQSASLQERLRLVTELTDAKVSVFDMSNAWEEGYLGIQKTTQLIQDLSPLMMADTHLVFTYQARAQSLVSGSETIFKYFVTPLSWAPAESLSPMLGQLMSQDPSRESRSRVPMNRFERD